ncbi:3-hydroxyacyl-ACP dehydratase FabZ [Mycobacterium sp. KBS0706]|uniref:3-hydroxyacyl-ACP dehydratase FabZ n=1 Tax=Mycobacterium sp. KBS0706 TaxID=2578109 RepID=UPI00110FB011|nr:3-hydroxyacyl-ACP dehydratase FabZ [Mycobacterium sp. KBS0706]TSD87944.1 3-hydroxyacyl-ACP dehydratase FabZ [Mycobacterium sp. KBS0706]
MDGAAGDKKNVSQLDILKIMELIPHRYPMILVDRVIDVVPDESCTGIKNVTINEGFFQGHFPRYPVMPGVMIVESMAQTAAVLVVATLGESAKGKLVYFMTVDNARFRRPVTPGDSLRVHVRKLQQRRNVWKFMGEAKVDGTLVAEAEFAAMIMDDL